MKTPFDKTKQSFFRRPTRWLVRLALIAGLLLGPVRSSRAFTVPLFSNLADVTNPQIDATAFINFGTVNVTNSNFFSVTFSQASLFQTLNTLNFTNTIGATLRGDLGFDLEFVTNSSRFLADNIVNHGLIQGDTVLLAATNLICSGPVSGGTLVQLAGQNVGLTRGVLSASLGVASLNSFSSLGFQSITTNGAVTYQNPNLVTDIYWGAGTGNVMSASSGFGLSLPTLNRPSGGFFPPVVASPSHEIEFLSNFGGLRRSLSPSFTNLTGTNYQAFVRSNSFGTNVTLQIVLVQTNTASTNLTVDVRFLSTESLVRFGVSAVDNTTGAFITNSLYFTDDMLARTNAVLGRSIQGSSSRPAAYFLTRSSFYDLYFTNSFFGGALSNVPISDITYDAPTFVNTLITNNFYGAYEVAVGNESFSPNLLTYYPTLDDPTNFPGRIEIVANNLDMSLAHIRADNYVSIRATNLISSAGTIIDAPYIQLSVANTNSTLTLTNFALPQIAQHNGTISFYSTTWTNTTTTNVSPQKTYRYHVLLVDASGLSGVAPVVLQEFSARGTNVIINNALNIGRAIQVDSPALTFSTSSSLSLPALITPNLVSSNFPNLNYFTNLGAISVPFQCALGSDRPTPIASFVNRGTFTANNIAIRATDYQSTGTNLTRSLVNGFNVGGGGPISITADSAKFDGGSGGGGLLSAGGSILLAGNDLKIRGHQFLTAGTLILSPTNSLTDTGASGTNRINCALGFYLTVKPVTGDLLGTTIYSTAPFNRDVPHVWAGANLGPVPAGYTNNAALGRLLLDTSNTVVSLNRLSFSGTGTNSALYVDYLELSGTLTNNLAAHLFIETNMTIYFANANVPVESLDGQLGGRLRWVKDYAGLNTGVDVRLPDGRTVKVNVAKLNSQVLDSDGDGIVNASDLSPFDGVILNSQVTFTNVPPLTAFVTWEAAAQTVYQIEVNTNLLTTTWQFLANFTNASATNRVVTFSDPVPAAGTERYFRVSYQP